jgi:hypothetical protein
MVQRMRPGTYLLPHAMSSTAGCVASVWGTSTQLKREVLAMLAHLQETHQAADREHLVWHHALHADVAKVLYMVDCQAHCQYSIEWCL